MFDFKLLVFMVAGCTAAVQPGDEGFNPLEGASEMADWVAPPPGLIELDTPAFFPVGQASALTVTGGLGVGERVYFAATIAGTGRGPCLPAAGGLCLGIRAPLQLLGSAVADQDRVATFSYTPNPAWPLGSNVSVQAVIIRSLRGIDSVATTPVTAPIANGPAEGTVLNTWTAFNFADNGYRNGCAGGREYVKSVGYRSARYVGVTLCDDDTYKIWLSDLLYGTFTSAGDWSGNTEDQCEYLGGDFIDNPQGATAVDANQPCWSRGAAGSTPVYEAVCTNNRWIAPAHDCNVSIPSGQLTGPAEGSTIATWTAFSFVDDGHADGCAGGDKYIKSTPYATPGYVGVTLCSENTYKIWLSDTVYGTFAAAGDWSGTGQDQCEYVGGDFRGFGGATAAVAPGESCWSRGNVGATPVFEATCLNNRWIAESLFCTVDIPAGTLNAPAEGSTITDWTAFDFNDNGYRDGCAGGDKYVMSTPYATPAYVGVTLCDADTYKIWLSDEVLGTFVSAGDWSGNGQDHCEYAGGSFVSFPSPALAVDPNQPCWSRGPGGVAPVYESVCTNNRWVPSSYNCTAAIP